MSQYAYYIMGPSGAGKDSVLAAVCDHFTDKVSRPSRYISRALAANDAEQHNVISSPVFNEFVDKACFSLFWEANGFHYGYDKQWLFDLQKGKIVLLNGSRSYWPEAKKRYGDKLYPIYLDLSVESQEARLKGRGRESYAEISERIARNEKFSHIADSDEIFRLNADQPLAAVFQDFIALLLSHQGER